MNPVTIAQLETRFRVGLEICQSAFDRTRQLLLDPPPPVPSAAPESDPSSQPSPSPVRRKTCAVMNKASASPRPPGPLTGRAAAYNPLVEFLSHHGPRTTEQLAAEFGKTASQACRWCHRAAAKGLVRRLERGLWGPASAAKPAAPPPSGSRKLSYEEVKAKMLGQSVQVPRDPMPDNDTESDI